MITTATLTADQAYDFLTRHLGYDPADVMAVLDSLVLAGLELEQPADGERVLSRDEFSLLVDQLRGE